MKSLRNLHRSSRFPNPLGSSQLPNAYCKNIPLFTLLFINIMKQFSSFLSFSSPCWGDHQQFQCLIVCESTCAILFGFLVVELAIVFCVSSLIKIPTEGQLREREPECPLHQWTLRAARLHLALSFLASRLGRQGEEHSQPKPSRTPPSPPRNGNTHIQISVQCRGLRKQGFCQG